MKYNLLVSLTLFIIVNCNAQKQEIIFNSDSVYSILLSRHLKYIEKNPNMHKYLKNSTIFIYSDIPLNLSIKTEQNEWQVKKIVEDSAYLLLKNEKYIFAFEFTPIFIENSKIVLKIFNLCISNYRGKIGMSINGSTTFIFAYDCENDNFKLIEEYNM